MLIFLFFVTSQSDVSMTHYAKKQCELNVLQLIMYETSDVVQSSSSGL